MHPETGDVCSQTLVLLIGPQNVDPDDRPAVESDPRESVELGLLRARGSRPVLDELVTTPREVSVETKGDVPEQPQKRRILNSVRGPNSSKLDLID